MFGRRLWSRLLPRSGRDVSAMQVEARWLVAGCFQDDGGALTLLDEEATAELIVEAVRFDQHGGLTDAGIGHDDDLSGSIVDGQRDALAVVIDDGQSPRSDACSQLGQLRFERFDPSGQLLDRVRLLMTGRSTSWG